jgi:hypothetical protein
MIRAPTYQMVHTTITLVVPNTSNPDGTFTIRIDHQIYRVVPTVLPGELMNFTIRVPARIEYVPPPRQQQQQPIPVPVPRPVPVKRPVQHVKSLAKKNQDISCGECPICLIEFTQLNCALLTCKHEICNNCMNELCAHMTISKPCICPLCRSTISRYTTFRKWGKQTTGPTGPTV